MFNPTTSLSCNLMAPPPYRPYSGSLSSWSRSRQETTWNEKRLTDNDTELYCVWFCLHALMLTYTFGFVRALSVFFFFLLYLDYVLCSFMFRAYSCLGEQALLLLMHNETTAISPLMCPYQMNVAYYRHSRVSRVALWTKKGLQGTMKETLSKIDHTVPL